MAGSEEDPPIDFWPPGEEQVRVWDGRFPAVDSLRDPVQAPPAAAPPLPEEQPIDFWPATPPIDGVPSNPATEADLDEYSVAGDQVGQMRVPVLVSDDRPDERLFVAAFDGTGANKFEPELGPPSGVAQLFDQLQARNAAGELDNISAGYVPGPGTGRYGTADGATGHTFEERAETMYRMFIEQAAEWLEKNPDADIRVAAMGFSRGAEEAAYFTRLVDERGIADPTGAQYTLGPDGLVTSVQYTKEPLVPPGEVIQAAALMDPVAEGDPRNYDRRLPPSVVSALQITARDEARDQFIGTPHLPPGMSDDGRSLNVTVPGVHSNIGDAYELDGLGTRNTNMLAEYLNGLIDSDKPVFSTRPEPPLGDPSNVIHDSEQHHPWIYTRQGFDADGVRDTNLQLGAPEYEEVMVTPEGDTEQRAILRESDTRREPIDETLAAGLEYRPLAEARSEATERVPGQDVAVQSAESQFDRLARAAMEGRADDALAAGREHADSQAGQTWRQEGAAAAREAERAQDAARTLPPMPPMVDEVARGAPVMR